MKDVLKALALPVPWAMILILWGTLIAIHAIAAPIRATIYWQRSLAGKTAWEAFFASPGEIGVWCYSSRQLPVEPGEE